MNPPESDRFKHDYHKYADEQVRGRQEGDAMGRLRMALFIAALGPGSSILMHTIGFTPSNFIRYGVQGTAILAVILLIVNFIRLPGPTKGSPMAVSVLILTLLAAAANYPLARFFSLLPA